MSIQSLASTSSCSSSEPPMKSFMQSLLQQNDITCVVSDNAQTHDALPLVECQGQSAKSQSELPRWDAFVHTQDPGSPSFPKRRLSVERNETIEQLSIEQVAEEVAESIANKNRGRNSKNYIILPDYQGALSAVQQRYSRGSASSRTSSLPSRPMRRESIEEFY